MSYVIHVWEAPRPTSFAEAAHIVFDRAEEVVGQTPAFVLLAEWLTARYPCTTRTSDAVWSDGPLDGRTDTRVYALGIRECQEEVFAHILEGAASLGLTVFDMQSAIAVLPSGQWLAKLPAAPPAALPPTLPEPPAEPVFLATAAMGYLVHVWEAPALLNYPEAPDIALNRGGDVLGQNLRFMILAEWLNARFPCNTLEPQVWRAGAVDGSTEQRVLVLDICDRHEEVSAYIFHCAGRLGLSAFDMQSETASNRNGGRLRPYVRPAVPAAPSVPMLEQLADIREAIYGGMMRVLGEVGFEYDRTGEGGLILRFPGGHHSIIVPVVNYYPLHYIFEFFVTTGLYDVATIASAFRGTRSVNIERQGTPSFACGYLYGEAGKEYKVASREGLALTITEINTVIVNKLLPLLDRISDVRGMDGVFNGPPANPPFQRHRDDGFDALTLARLANNPDYPALCARYLNAIYPGNRKLRRDLPRLIAYLDHYDADNPAPPPPYPFDDVARFITDYDGSQVDEIAVKSVGSAGRECFDVNRGFRAELLRNDSPPVLNFPLPLLRDLLRAEAQVRTALEVNQVETIGTLMHGLLSQGGPAELAFVLECVAVPWLSNERMMEVVFDPHVEESLRHACEKRIRNPRYADMAEQYAAFERYFAAPKMLRGADFMKLLASLKLPRDQVYDDYTGTNSWLWDGEQISLRLISERGYAPSVRIAGRTYLYHCEVSAFDEVSIQDFLRYVREHEAEVCDAAQRAADAKKDLRISLSAHSVVWVFKQRARRSD